MGACLRPQSLANYAGGLARRLHLLRSSIGPARLDHFLVEFAAESDVDVEYQMTCTRIVGCVVSMGIFFALCNAACGPSGGGTPTPPDGNDNSEPDGGTPQRQWQLVLHDLPGGLLSVSGTSSSDVYAVGTDMLDGQGPMVLHYDGAAWTRLATGASGGLWWISDTLIGDGFFMTGDGGLILRYRPAAAEFERFETPGTQTIFGVWGRAADDVTAVGGDLDDFETGGVIWHFNGQDWTQVDVSSIDPQGIPVLFKVWGRSPSELYAVGAGGAVLRYDGTSWTRLQSLTDTDRTLFGVYGDNHIVVACGGALGGVIIEQDADGFADVTPEGALQMNGAFVTSAGEAYTVGLEGSVALRSAAGWAVVDTGLALDTILHFHGPWGDPDGGLWAVGGNLDGDPIDQGMVVYYGLETIQTQLSD